MILIESIVGGKDKRAMLRILFFSWGVVQFPQIQGDRNAGFD